jgi:hypothetical protein
MSLMELIKRQTTKEETFWQKRILPEEERRRQFPTMPWIGSYRWFQSPNVIDLWPYRSPTARARISAMLRRE